MLIWIGVDSYAWPCSWATPCAMRGRRGLDVGGSSEPLPPPGGAYPAQHLAKHACSGLSVLICKRGPQSCLGFAVRINEELYCAPAPRFASPQLWSLGVAHPACAPVPAGGAAGAGVRGGHGGELAYGDLGPEHPAPLELEDTGALPPQRFGSPQFRPGPGIPAAPARLRSQTALVQIPALPLVTRVTLSGLPSFSESAPS